MCIDELCRRHGVELAGLGGMLQFKKTRINGHEVVLAKPMTYMNESGIAVHKLQRMFDFDLANMLVIYDDIDLPLGDVRIREKGSAGTHKGMKSVIQHSGSQDFPRLRIGIQGPGRQAADIVHYVLAPAPGQEIRSVPRRDRQGGRRGRSDPGKRYSQYHEYIQQEKELLASSKRRG